MNLLDWFRWPEQMTGIWRTGYTHGYSRGIIVGLIMGLAFGVVFGWLIWGVL